MKKLLLLLLCVPLLFSCGENEELGKDNNSENRVLLDELTNKGTKESELMYYESGLFNGIGFDVYEDGELKSEKNYIDGKRNGLCKYWLEDGQLYLERNYKDGKHVGVKEYYKNGQLRHESNYKGRFRHGLYKEWYENGQLQWEGNYKNQIKEIEYKLELLNNDQKELEKFARENFLMKKENEDIILIK